MDVAELEFFKSYLTQREKGLTELLSSLASFSAEETAKVRSLLREIKEALSRVEDKTYGRCSICDGKVEHHRLIVQPAATVCLECISDSERAQLEEELSVASKIHRKLLPQDIPVIEGFDVAVKAEASRMVGGDYYDFLKTSNGDRTRIIIADSMGKGIPGGLLMSNLQGALRVLSEMTDCSATLLTDLNQWICHNIPMTKFISLFCIELPSPSETDATITYTNAGHPPPILLRNNGEIQLLQAAGIVLGVHESSAYASADIEIEPGDMLLMYTDGVTEAQNQQGEMFDEERLLEFVKSHAEQDPESLLDDLVSEIREFKGNWDLDDDFTVLALRKKDS